MTTTVCQQTTITITWFMPDEIQGLSPQWTAILDEQGKHMACEYMRDGLTSGYLHETLYRSADDKDGVDFRGHWNYTRYP